MEQRNNPQIINSHMRIKNVRDLKEYLENYFATYDFECDELDEENMLDGYFGDTRFEIYYERGKRLILKTDVDCDEELEVLKRVLTPVMWYKDKSCKDDHIGPIAKYKSNDIAFCEWEYEKPLEALKKLAFEYYKTGAIDEIELLYKNYKIEDFEEDMRYGAYTGVFDQEALDEIENFNEFDIFCLIKSYMDKEREIIDAANLLRVNVDEQIDNIDFQVAYIVQTLRRFGVDPGEPTEEYEGFSPEAEAWFRWWEESYDDIVDDHPELLDNVFQPKQGKVIYRPKGTFKDILPTVIKERKEQSLSDIANISKGEDDTNSGFAKLLDKIFNQPGGDE